MLNQYKSSKSEVFLSSLTNHSKNVGFPHPPAYRCVCGSANARQPCDDTDDCVDERHVCRGGFCILPRSFRQLLVAANPIGSCLYPFNCPKEKPYCVNGQCRDHKNLGYRLASYEYNPILGCFTDCPFPTICNELTHKCVLRM
uniref:Uncharacterized protein n=1 Tax=Ditylenchus dipsaci TaxID=166011 RepID=A0A915E6F1_9BILA